MSDKKPKNRRDFIFTATAAAGAVGVGAAVWPLVDQMNPDASVKALASTEVDISSVKPGQSITVVWRGKPVFIKRRTQEEIEKARSVSLDELKHPEKMKIELKILNGWSCLEFAHILDVFRYLTKENLMDGFALVMDHTMTLQEE